MIFTISVMYGMLKSFVSLWYVEGLWQFLFCLINKFYYAFLFTEISLFTCLLSVTGSLATLIILLFCRCMGFLHKRRKSLLRFMEPSWHEHVKSVGYYSLLLHLLPGSSSLLISTLPVHSPAFFPKPLPIFSCVGLQNKIGHPAGCRFPCWVPAAYK